MARPKSEERRNAILDALTQTIASKGVSASTLAVAKMAGVSEGTIFKHFVTKDELLNSLYAELKLEIADALMSGFPRRLSVRSRLQFIWGPLHNVGQRTLRQVPCLTAAQPMGRLDGHSEDCRHPAVSEHPSHLSRTPWSSASGVPVSEQLVGATITAFSEMAITLIHNTPEMQTKYMETCFEMLWSSLKKS